MRGVDLLWQLCGLNYVLSCGLFLVCGVGLKIGATNTGADAYGGTVRLGLTLDPVGFGSSVGVFLQSDSFGSELGFRVAGLLAGATVTSVIKLIQNVK